MEKNVIRQTRLYQVVRTAIIDAIWRIVKMLIIFAICGSLLISFFSGFFSVFA